SLLRAAAASGLASQGRRDDIPLVATLLLDSDSRVALDTLESVANWPEEMFSIEIRNALRVSLEKKDPAMVSQISGIVERFKWKDFGPTLVSAYSGLGKPDLVESKVAVLAAIGAIGDNSYVAVLEG